MRWAPNPSTPQLDAVKQAATRDAQAALMGRTGIDFEGSLFNLSFDVDLKDTNRYAVYVSQAGLGLPDRDYYLKPEFAKQKAAYQAYVTKLLTLVGWAQPEAAAKDVVAFETAIAQASISKVEQRDPVAMYNPMSVGDLEKLAPGFAWNDFLKSAQLGQLKHLVVMEKTAFPKLAALYAKTPVSTIQAWQAARIADNAAYYLSTPFQQAYFEMHEKTLAGQQQMEAPWKRGVHAVSGGDCGAGERLVLLRQPRLGRGPAVYRQVFSRLVEGQDRRTRRQPESGVSRAHRTPGLDGPGNAQGSVEEARHLHHQGGLSRSSA